MSFVKKLSSGKSQIAKDNAFCTLLDSQLPDEELEFSELFSMFDSAIRKIDPRITREALSNAHGDWYEWLLAIVAWNGFLEGSCNKLALLLPNVSQFDVSTLYSNELCALIDDLKDKVSNSSSVELISSNPDFVIVDAAIAKRALVNESPINKITIDTLNKLQSAYQKFIGQCSFDDLVGYISVKTSFRPDRRLQIAHEGSLMKALYVHLQTRQWILKPTGLKYYAMATKVGPKDREALKTVATHSITTVHSLPQAAVDEVFEVNSLRQTKLAFDQALY